MKQSGSALKVALVIGTYPPEPVVSAQIGQDVANYVVASGAIATVLCPYPSRPLGARYAEFDSRKEPKVDDEAGVKVVRLPSFTAPASGLLVRMWESISFGWHVCRYLARQRDNVDVLYANTWPLFSQELIARHCARQGIPLVLHVQDIYPEALESKLPQWLGRCVIPALRRWDRRIAHLAAKVVVVAEEARRTYAKTRLLPDERVELVHNWQDERRFLSAPSRAVAAQECQTDGTAFNFLYLGNIGPATDMELAIRAFARASIPGSQLLIIGTGSAKQACMALTKELGVRAVRFLPCASASDAPVMQALADVCLLPLKRGVALNGVPSKLAAYLFSAKPVLAMLDAGSDTARFILEAKCGWVGEPGNVNWLSAKMEEVAALPPRILVSMGQCGRAYALERFSRAGGVKRLGGLLLATGGHGCGPADSRVPQSMASAQLGALG